MNEMYVSECGGYVCRHVPGPGNYEAWTVDGSIHWRHDNRIQTWADARKPRHPMVYAVGGWSCEKTGQKKGSFTLDLCHCDVTKLVDSFTGNTLLETRLVVFRRKVQSNHIAACLRRLGLL